MAGRTRTPSEDVEKALVDAAEAVLVREGPAAVTVRAVATEAGVAPMGVYNRFGGKDGLAAALMARGFDRLRDGVAAHDVAGDPAERLRIAGIRYREFALANPRLYQAMFEGTFAVAPDAPACAEQGAAAFGELVGHVVAVLGAPSVEDPDAVETAQQIWAAVHGAVSLELNRLVWTPDPEATYLRLLDLLIRGVAPRG